MLCARFHSLWPRNELLRPTRSDFTTSPAGHASRPISAQPSSSSTPYHLFPSSPSPSIPVWALSNYRPAIAHPIKAKGIPIVPSVLPLSANSQKVSPYLSPIISIRPWCVRSAGRRWKANPWLFQTAGSTRKRCVHPSSRSCYRLVLLTMRISQALETMSIKNDGTLIDPRTEDVCDFASLRKVFIS